MNPQQPPYQSYPPQQPGWPGPGGQHSNRYPYPSGGYPVPGGQQWPLTPPTPKKHRKWPWVVGAVMLLIIIVGSTSKPATPTVASTASSAASPTRPAVQAAAAAPAAPAPAPEAALFSPGTYEVGKGDGQIPPGKYKSTGPDGSNAAGCYYARLHANDGSLEDILSNNVTQGPSIFTVKPTDGYVEIAGCSFAKA